MEVRGLIINKGVARSAKAQHFASNQTCKIMTGCLLFWTCFTYNWLSFTLVLVIFYTGTVKIRDNSVVQTCFFSVPLFYLQMFCKYTGGFYPEVYTLWCISLSSNNPLPASAVMTEDISSRALSTQLLATVSLTAVTKSRRPHFSGRGVWKSTSCFSQKKSWVSQREQVWQVCGIWRGW